MNADLMVRWKYHLRDNKRWSQDKKKAGIKSSKISLLERYKVYGRKRINYKVQVEAQVREQTSSLPTIDKSCQKALFGEE